MFAVLFKLLLLIEDYTGTALVHGVLLLPTKDRNKMMMKVRKMKLTLAVTSFTPKNILE